MPHFFCVHDHTGHVSYTVCSNKQKHQELRPVGGVVEKIELILGTMTFGSQADDGESRKVLDLFINAGWTSIDSAFIYCEGASERIAGEWMTQTGYQGVTLSTKGHPRVTGKLDTEAVRHEFETSLKRFQTEQVDILCLHQPDLHHSIEDPLEMCAEYHAHGKFRRLGLSNFPVWMVEKIYYVCEKNGWPKPEVYQGMYNAVTRKVEAELFPALRDLDMQFHAYNPLAGGLLTGKYTSLETAPDDGRFAVMPHYLDRYWKKNILQALLEFESECAVCDISTAHAALHWIIHHSMLSSDHGDAIVLGASNAFQFKDNLAGVRSGFLPGQVVHALDDAWRIAANDSPDYFRFYTS